MVPDPMQYIKVEVPPKGQPLETPRSRRIGRRLLFILLVAVAGFGAYREIRRPGCGLPELKAFWKNIVSRQEKGVQAKPPATAPDPFEIRHLALHPGETFEEIVKRLNVSALSPADFRNPCLSSSLESIRENDELLLVSNRADARPLRLVYLRSGGGAYTLTKNSSGWECGKNENEAGTTVHGALTKSFYHSCAACGLPAPLISSLADIFSGDVDFLSDLKTGDSISVFFQKYPIASCVGKRFLVLGAEISVSGKVCRAFGFETPGGAWGYFDAKGATLERSFSKLPLNYRPLLDENGGAVLKVFRPRFEIMYIVPTAAQVCSVGEGVVTAVHNRSERRFSIEIRHGGGYSSWYGNLSALSSGMKRGTVVHRSSVIGSPGPYESGKAYFDFQFLKSGRPVDLQTEEFAPARSLPEKMMAEFGKTRDVCMAALNGRSVTEEKPQTPSGGK